MLVRGRMMLATACATNRTNKVACGSSGTRMIECMQSRRYVPYEQQAAQDESDGLPGQRGHKVI